MLNNLKKLMIVRASVICFVILTASFTAVVAQDGEISPRIRVMAFYKWYLHWTNEKHDLTKNKGAMENYFSTQFNGRIYSTEGQSAGRNLFVDGPQWNNAWAKNVNVGEAAITGNRATVKLMLGAPADKTLQITLVKQGSEWKIDGISTGETDRVAAAPGPTTRVASPAAAYRTSASLATTSLDRYGNLFISPPTRQLTIADLVGNWGDNPGRIATTYVYKSDGAYAGTDSLHFTSKSTIDADGRYGNDFFEVRNGQKLRDITTGTVSIDGRLLTIKQKGTTKYFIRGWLELPDMTIMKLIGPWYDNQEIDADVFTNPEKGENLSKKWVRMK